jgi:hypothetical protein
MACILDRLPLVDELIYEDLIRNVDDPENGRPGLSGSQVSSDTHFYALRRHPDLRTQLLVN